MHWPSRIGATRAIRFNPHFITRAPPGGVSLTGVITLHGTSPYFKDREGRSSVCMPGERPPMFPKGRFAIRVD